MIHSSAAPGDFNDAKLLNFMLNVNTDVGFQIAPELKFPDERCGCKIRYCANQISLMLINRLAHFCDIVTRASTSTISPNSS